MLKYETTEVPQGLDEYYEKTDSGYRLKVEGVVPADEHKSKVNEFRDSNIQLKRKVDDLTRYEQMFQSGDLSSEKLAAKIDEQARIKAADMKAAFNREIADRDQKLNGVQAALHKTLIESTVSQAAVSHGVVDGGLSDVFNRAKSVFTVVDGELRASKIGEDGKDLTVDAWMKQLVKEASFLFAPSRGSGTKQISQGSVGSGRVMSPADYIAQGRMAQAKRK